MTEFKVGDKVKIARTISSVIRVGDTAVVARVDRPSVALKLDSPRGPYLDAVDAAFHCWTSEANLALVEEPVGEKMIPASKVREIARLYATRHGWCGVVDDALREMGAADDTLVDVTVVQTRTIRMRRSDLDKMNTEQQMLDSVSSDKRIRFIFNGNRAPEGATLEHFAFDISEPVEVKTGSMDEWVDWNPSYEFRDGEELRFRPGVERKTWNYNLVPEGVTMRAGRNGRADDAGDITVAFSQDIDGMDRRAVPGSRLQHRRSS